MAHYAYCGITKWNDNNKDQQKKSFQDQADGYTLVPVILNKSPNSNLNELVKKWWLVEADLKIIQFQFKVMQMLNIPFNSSLFLYSHNYMVWEPTTTFRELYEIFNRKNIYLKYTEENLYITQISQ